MKRIYEKVNQLGGLEPLIDNIIGGTSILQNSNFLLPKEIKTFVDKYGGYAFKKDVVVTGVDNIPVSSNGCISIGMFLDFGDKQTLQNINIEHFPKGHFPFAEGAPGDLLITNNEGKIFYWYHEGYEGEDVYQVADSFEQFIQEKLQIEDSDEDDPRKLISIRLDF